MSSVVDILKARLAGAADVEPGSATDGIPTIYVARESLVGACFVLRDDPALGFSVLIDAIPIDFFPREPRFEISYLLLKGKCAKCSAKISARYPIVEFVTAVMSAMVAWKFGFHWYTGAALVLTWFLIALTVIDFDTQLLPDNMTLPLMWIGLLLSLAGTVPELGMPPDMKSSILGAVAGYLSLWSVYQLFKLVTGKEGMGYGDFKLFAALGAWMGWQMLPLIILLSAFTGAVVGIVLIVARGRDRNIPIPFGPYLAAAGWIALMWGDQIVGSYLAVSGIGSRL